MKRSFTISIVAILFSIFVFYLINLNKFSASKLSQSTTENLISGNFDKAQLKSDSQWKKLLTTEQFYILREAGTEPAYSGELNNEKRLGTYFSVGCDKPLFRSEQKYDSKTGWPSFWAPINDDVLVLRKDTSFGIERIEVLDTCGGHLGHLFDDGPEPTGERFCMNSIALRFVPDEDLE